MAPAKERHFGGHLEHTSPEERLRLLLEDTAGAFDDVLNREFLDGHKRIVPTGAVLDVVAAWNLHVRTDVLALSDELRNIASDHLLSHGLDGFHLNFKLKAIKRIHDRFRRHPVGKFLAKFIDAIVSLLESAFGDKAEKVVEWLTTLAALLL